MAVKEMNFLDQDNIRKAVRDRYAKAAMAGTTDSCCDSASCCDDPATDVKDISMDLGYSKDEVQQVPEGANLGLGCGNPKAIASLKTGETVLDLGSGGGFDCFLAAREVGVTGTVIGVDMTPEMISQARANADKAAYSNVEFRLGEIENLPLADGTVDVIISNCVINLSPHKARVFQEAFRVLKPGGRLAISDVVATSELPSALKRDLSLLTGCVSGASFIADLESMIEAAGFESIAIRPKDESREFIQTWVAGSHIEDYVLSATIEAIKPRT